MKRIAIIAALLLLLLFIPAAASGQQIHLDVETNGLASRSIETVEITLDGPLLRLACRFLSAEDGDAAALGPMIRKLEGIYVRSYTFAEDGAYDFALVDKFRSQLTGGWQKIVNVQKQGEENVEIYTRVRGETIGGLVVIAAEPRQLTFVNLVGEIDPADFSRLEGHFGIPRVGSVAAKRD